MKRALLVALTVALAACGRSGTEAPVAISLVHEFEGGWIERAATPEEREPTVWRPADEGGGPLRVAGKIGLEELADGGNFRATTGSPRSLLVLESSEPLGPEDQLYAVEVRMRASAGSTLMMTTLGPEGPPSAAFAAPDGPPLAFRLPLVAGDEIGTYRIEEGRSFSTGPVETRGIRRLLLRPTDAEGAEVEIESVRIIFRREHFAGIPSGIGWHGLGGVFRETLLLRAGEVARAPLQVPDEAWLDLAVGTLEERPVRFSLDVELPGGEVLPLLRRTVTTPERWEPDPIDLSRLAGRTVELLFEATSDEEAALALWGNPTVRRNRAGAAAWDSDRPQGVVLVIADTLRRDHLSAYGYERETSPVLERLASEGVLFRQALAQGTWTKISVPSILSSLHPASHGLVGFTDRLPAGVTTLAEIFREAGYATLQTSSVPFSGQLSNLQQGVEVLHESDSIRTAEGTELSKTGKPLTDRVLDWIELHREVPFFALLHAMDPHSPYRPATPYDGWWTDAAGREVWEAAQESTQPHIEEPLFRQFKMPKRSDLVEAGVDPDVYVRHEIGWYDGSIRALDGEIGRLIDRLEHFGLRDRVVVAVVSDHGEEFLEHGRHWHGVTVYGEQTDVPFLLWGPGFLPAGVSVAPTVQLLDLLPTLADLARLPTPAAAQGQSLLPLVSALAAGEGAGARGWQERPAFAESGKNSSSDSETFAGGPSVAIVDGRWKLIEFLEPPEGRARFQLFDRAADPLDQEDLADDHPQVVDSLAEKLAAWRAWTEEQRVEPDSVGDLSAEELERLRALGYL